MFAVITQHKLVFISQTKDAGGLPFDMCAVLYHKTGERSQCVKGDDVRGTITGHLGYFGPLPGHISPALWRR